MNNKDKTMQIQITQKNIYEGEGGCGLSCAVALAVRDKFKTNDVHVSITHEDDDKKQYQVGIQVKDKHFVSNDPNVYYFISDFDMGGAGAVKPMQFTINQI